MPVWSWVQHHRLLSIGSGVIVVLVAAVAVVYLVFFRTAATPFSVRQAISLYRHSHPTGSPSHPGLPGTGVYLYTTTGHEGLDLPGMNRTFPSPTPMIVSGSSCQTVRWEPITEHVEEFEQCAGPHGGLWMPSTTSLEQIAGQNTTTVMTCPQGTWLRPPSATAGETWSTTCHTGAMAIEARGRVIGSTTVTVDGAAVRAWHTRLTLVFSGNESGTTPADYWLATSDNLILRQHETAHIAQQAGPLGSVRYQEQMTADLRSLTPVA